jgi:hypothetical protein
VSRTGALDPQQRRIGASPQLLGRKVDKNRLDLWAAVHHLSLGEAALHPAHTFHLQLTSNREEEPVPGRGKPR